MKVKYILGICLLFLLMLCPALQSKAGNEASAQAKKEARQDDAELEKIDQQLAAMQQEATQNVLDAQAELDALEKEIQSSRNLYTVIMLICAVAIITLLTLSLRQWQKSNRSDNG